MRRLTAIALVCLLNAPQLLTAEEIPVDYFQNVTLDAPIPVPIRTGERIIISGTVDEGATYEILALSFSSSSLGLGLPLWFNSAVTDGRFEITLFFDHGFSGTYALELSDAQSYNNTLGKYWPFVIERGSEPLERGIKGFELEQPIPEALAVDELYLLKGRATDPEIKSMDVVADRFDNVSGEFFGNVVFDSTRAFELPIQFSPEAEGNYILKVYVYIDEVGDHGYVDRWVLRIKQPQADVGILALSLIPETTGHVPVINRGDAPLELSLEHVDDPFEVVSFPDVVPPHQMVPIEVAFHGSSAAQGEIVVRTSDPEKPEIVVALSGTAADHPPIELHRLVANESGLLRGDLDFGESDFVLALYSPGIIPYAERYSFTIGDPPAAKSSPSPAPSAPPDPFPAGRAAVEAALGEREQQFARRFADSGAPYAAKPAGVDYQVGDERTFAVPQPPDGWTCAAPSPGAGWDTCISREIPGRPSRCRPIPQAASRPWSYPSPRTGTLPWSCPGIAFATSGWIALCLPSSPPAKRSSSRAQWTTPPSSRSSWFSRPRRQNGSYLPSSSREGGSSVRFSSGTHRRATTSSI